MDANSSETKKTKRPRSPTGRYDLEDDRELAKRLDLVTMVPRPGESAATSKARELHEKAALARLAVQRPPWAETAGGSPMRLTRIVVPFLITLAISMFA